MLPQRVSVRKFGSEHNALARITIERSEEVSLRIQREFGFSQFSSHRALRHLTLDPPALLALVLAVLLSFGPALRRGYARFTAFWLSPAPGTAVVTYGVALVLLVLSLSALAAGGFNPFIYFRF